MHADLVHTVRRETSDDLAVKKTQNMGSSQIDLKVGDPDSETNGRA
jgi:hypothetical protein